MTTDSKCIPIAAYARTNNANTTGSFCGSIEEQLNAIRYWAKYNNCKIVREYNDECISGFKNCPPDLIWLTNEIEEQKIIVKYVVVCAFNRISRNICVNMWLQDKLDVSETQLISLSESCYYKPFKSYSTEDETLYIKKTFGS
jgi:DNA invertase Pin-like site-specific DNA recombinase